MSKKTRNRFGTLFFAAIVAILAVSPLLSVQTGLAQGPGGPSRPVELLPGSSSLPRTQLEANKVAPGLGIEPSAFARETAGQVNIIIVLDETPALVAASQPDLSPTQAVSAANNQIARIEVAQQTVLNSMSSLGVSYNVMGATERVLGTVIVRADASDLILLNTLPGVKEAVIEPIGYLDNSSSVPFIGAPTAWNSGFTGNGIRVGVIDDGIDYDHVNFGGDGNGLCDFATEFGSGGTSKVEGGYDFVGDTWVAGGPLVPDADPCPQSDHGTHVAGTIGGFGVQGGVTYAGTYDAATPFGSMDIGPGVAPEVELYALKIGASTNSVSGAAAILAMEWAVDPDGNPGTNDALHVINQSWGGIYGDPDSATSQALDNAALAGIVMVGSAGNSGDSYFIHGAPNIADWALSVASSLDGSPGVEITAAPTLGVPVTFEAGAAGFGPAVFDVTADLELVNDGTGTVTDGCEALVGFTPGNIALIDRGTCGFTVKVSNAQTAGAVGVLIANNGGAFGGLGGTDPTITIPSVMVDTGDGATLTSEVGLGTVTVHMSNTIVFGASADTLSGFSSRGGQYSANGANVGVKPDVAAPGNSITSSLAGSGNGSLTIGGTSMAAPHVAGAAALMRQQYPGWTVQEIKALLMSTATNEVYAGNNQTPPVYDPARAGTGRVDVASATASEVIAYNATNDELVSVSFGVIDATSAGSAQQTITVENKSGTPRGYDVSFVGLSDIDGVSYNVSPASINVPAGGTSTVTVTLNYSDPSTWASPHSHAPTVEETQLGLPRHWLAEESGLVQLEYNGAVAAYPDLWVSVYASVRPAGTMASTQNPVLVPTTAGSLDLEMAGTAVSTAGVFPYAETGLVTAFELVSTSPQDPVLTGTSAAGDIEHIGLMTDYPAVLTGGGTVADSMVFFGLSTYGDWSSIAENPYFELYIDIDEDGGDDYLMYIWNFGAANGLDSNDTYITVLVDLVGGGAFLYDFVNFLPASALDTRLLQSNVFFFGIAAADIGLSDANPDFDFYIVGYQWNVGVSDVSDLLSYNLTTPVFDVTGGFTGFPALWDDQVGPAVPVTYDLNNYVGAGDPCVLLLHHQNVSGQRAETVCFEIESAEPADETDPGTGDSGASGGTATGDPEEPTALPSTGYPPAEEDSPSSTLPLILAGGAMVLSVVAAGVALRRRTR